jgi:hypothetical protein
MKTRLNRMKYLDMARKILKMKAAFLISIMFGVGVVNAADCTNAMIVASTDENIEFIDNQNGTVTDTSTRLMWMRCAAGQTWNQGTRNCDGSVLSYSWKDALDATQSYNAGGGYAGNNDWRVPNINELRSIVEDCKSEPAINVTLFPATPSAKFWTSSTYVSLGSNAWLVDFDQGRDNFELKTNKNAVRLVRIAD